MKLENMDIDLGKGYIQDITLCAQELFMFYKSGNLKATQEYMFYIKEAMDKLNKLIGGEK